MLTIKDIDFELEVEYCQDSIEGNASAIDEDTDNDTYEWILTELDCGNIWAWCDVKVTASYKGFEGVDYLGQCSYESKESFKTPGGYYEDMKAVALADLISNIRSAVEQLEGINLDELERLVA